MKAVASGTVPGLRGDAIDKILTAGLLQLSVGDRRIVDVQDLTHFPSDGGLSVGAAFDRVASAADFGSCWWSNGAPIAGNRFRLPAPYPILPGKPISAQIKWQTALTIAAAGRIKLELVGESVMPLNA